MDAALRQFLFSLASGLVIAVATGVLTVSLSLRRFRLERWWEKKYDAYTTIVTALYHVHRYAVHWLDAHRRCADIEADRKADLIAARRKGFMEIGLATAVGALIISPAAVEALQKLDRDLDAIEFNGDLSESAEREAALVMSAIVAIQAHATADLRLDSRLSKLRRWFAFGRRREIVPRAPQGAKTVELPASK
jgi:hypothetical protein